MIRIVKRIHKIVKIIIKIVLFIAVCATVLIIIATAAARLAINNGVYTHWFEKAASDAVGLQILINGRPEISFFPRLSIRAFGARLRNGNEDIIVAKEAEITPEIISLSKMTFRVRGITLRAPNIFVRRFPDGRFNFAKYSTVVSSLPVLGIDRISVFGGTLNYADVASSGGFKAEDLNIEAQNLSVSAGRSDEFLKHFSFAARATSKLVNLNGLEFSNIKFKCVCDGGIFTFDPAALGIFGGKCTGSIVVNPTIPVAQYRANFTLSDFRIEKYLKMFYPNIAISGAANFTAKLALSGNTWDDMMKSEHGETTTTGDSFTLLGGKGAGRIVDKVSGTVHHYYLTCSLSKVRVEKYLKQLVQYKVPYGPMDLTANLFLNGETFDQMQRGMRGEVTLTGNNLRYFGGKCSGKLVADIARHAHRYFVICNLTNFRIEQYVKTFYPKTIIKGPMNLTANLTMQGENDRELKRTSIGYVTLSGDNLEFFGSDLDKEFARVESSQNFNLIDAGAYYFIGPLALLATKGYNFASILKDSGGTTNIGRLYSSWHIDKGVALAEDVAMATRKYRVVINGKIDFAAEVFDDVTLAIIDAKNCAIVKQKITGSFQKPVAQNPSAISALAGPAINLLKKGKSLVTFGKCDVYYTGSVPPPK